MSFRRRDIKYREFALESKNFQISRLINREVAIELIFGGDEVLYRYF